jgi:hypothetical protein
MTPESKLLKAIQIRATTLGWRVFRNNVSLAWVGQAIHVKGQPRTILLRQARRLKTGLCVGSADLIGWDNLGRFVALEVKTWKGKATEEQLNFIAAVNRAGGYARIVRSEQDL